MKYSKLIQKGGVEIMAKGKIRSGKTTAPLNNAKKAAANTSPYIAGGAVGAVIGAGVGVAAAAVMQNAGARERVTEVFDTVRDRMREMPQAQQMLGGGQQKEGMKLGKISGRGKGASGKNSGRKNSQNNSQNTEKKTQE